MSTPRPITRRTKLWLGLGAFTFLMGEGARAQTPAPASGEMGGGEGGEGGEGGIDAARAGTDPVAYITALDVAAAHYLAGREAYLAGDVQTASALFAHPIIEILVPMEDVLKTRGAPDLQTAMERARDLALDGAPADRIAVAVDGVLEALLLAEAQAPEPGPTLKVSAQTIGELADRAALQAAFAARTAEVEPYLDGLGLFLAARRRSAGVVPALDAAGRTQAAIAMRTALDALAVAYPGAARPERAPDAGALSVATANLKLVLEDLP